MDEQTPDLEVLLKRLDALEAENAQLREENARLRAENARLRQRVQDLEYQLAQNSSNSHRPPSTDDPWDDDDDEDDDGHDDEIVFDFQERRQQGAQPGHTGHHRRLADPEDVDEVVDLIPDECHDCGHDLAGRDPTPWRHQVVQVELDLHRTEYRMHRLRCPCCQTTQRAELPDEVGLSPFDDSVAALVSWMTGRFDLSKRDARDFLRRGFGLSISLGAVCGLERRAQRALGPAHQHALAALNRAEVLWVDETGWFEQHERAWVWSALADDTVEVTVYRIDASRSREALRKLIAKDVEGIVTSDRYSAYNGRDPSMRQICWQHLMRDFKGLCARAGPGAAPARRLLTIAELIFETRHDIQHGELPEDYVIERVEQAWRPATHKILKEAANQEGMPGIFENLLAREQALWTFVYEEGVEPTNNRAERAVRPAVLKRKKSYGTQSSDGSRFIERILTVCETLRRQGRSVLDFLTKSLRACRLGQQPPQLVPA